MAITIVVPERPMYVFESFPDEVYPTLFFTPAAALVYEDDVLRGVIDVTDPNGVEEISLKDGATLHDGLPPDDIGGGKDEFGLSYADRVGAVLYSSARPVHIDSLIEQAGVPAEFASRCVEHMCEHGFAWTDGAGRFIGRRASAHHALALNDPRPDLISETQPHRVQIVLRENGNRPLTADEIVTLGGIDPVYIDAILDMLTRRGLVSGSNGRYRLA